MIFQAPAVLSGIPAGVDFSTTPHLYYALAYWLGCVFYIHALPRRLKGWKLAVMEVSLLLLLSALLFAMETASEAWFIPNVLMRVVLMYGCIMVCCDVDWKKGGYFFVRAFILAEFAASLEWQLFYYGLTVLGLPLRHDINILFLLGSHGCCFGVMNLLERKSRDTMLKLQISKKDCFSALLIAMAVFGASNLGYAFESTPFSSQFPAEIYIIRTWVDLAGVIMLFANQLQLQEVHARMELESLHQVMHMHYANYRLSRESVELVERKYHDLKHQIDILRTEAPQIKQEYLDQLEQEIKTYEAQNKTGNHILDTILTTKSLQCQNQGISLTCVADGSALSFMNTMDLSALFGNALDNAIESVSKIANPEKRLIHLSVARQRQFLRIRVENCYEGELLYENGDFLTTKADKQHHGFGLKSMKETVAKYNGSMAIEAQDGWFELRILFPLPESVVFLEEEAAN